MEKVNNSLTRMLGYTEDHLLSINFQNITHPDDLSTDLKKLDALSRGEIPFYQLEKEISDSNRELYLDTSECFFGTRR